MMLCEFFPKQLSITQLCFQNENVLLREGLRLPVFEKQKLLRAANRQPNNPMTAAGMCLRTMDDPKSSMCLRSIKTCSLAIIPSLFAIDNH